MPARSSSALLETAIEDGCVSDAVVAENLTQAHQLWHIRESIPLAQAEEGLNIKHDISIPVSRIPEFVPRPTRCSQREMPGVRLVNFGHLGDGNLHYNVQAPAGRDNGGLPAQTGKSASTRWSTTRSSGSAARSRPSTASAA